MIKNYKGNDRYLLLEGFNGREVDPSSLNLVEFGREEKINYCEKVLFDYLRRECGEELSYRDFEYIFGLAYISQEGYGLITLDTNHYVFIDENYYLGFLVVDNYDGVYVACYNHEGDDLRYFYIN